MRDGIRKPAVGYGGGEGRLEVKMARREKEHYEIARRFDRPFTLFEFKSLYRKEYPDRASVPDYCRRLNLTTDWTVPGVSHIGMIEKEHALTSLDRNLAMCPLVGANRIGGIRRRPVRTALH